MGDKWQTSVKSCGQSTVEHPELTGRQVGDKWETSVKSCGQSTESIQSLLGDNWETSGRQMGNKWETSIKSCGQSTESIQSLLGDKWETSGRQMGHKFKIMRPEHSEHPELTGRQVETSVKSCGQSTQSIQSLLGDNWETNKIMRPEH